MPTQYKSLSLYHDVLVTMRVVLCLLISSYPLLSVWRTIMRESFRNEKRTKTTHSQWYAGCDPSHLNISRTERDSGSCKDIKNENRGEKKQKKHNTRLNGNLSISFKSFPKLLKQLLPKKNAWWASQEKRRPAFQSQLTHSPSNSWCYSMYEAPAL